MTTATQISGLVTGHVGLNVRDLDEAVRFFTALFGWTVIGRSDQDARRFAFLGQGETLILTLWQQAEDDFAPTRAGLHHLSFQVPTLADVQDIQARLRELGGAPLHDGVVPHSEGASSGGLFFLGPDGIRLEVFTAKDVEGEAPSGSAPTCGFF